MNKSMQKITVGLSSFVAAAQLAAGTALAAINGGTINVSGKGYAANIGGVISSVMSFVMVLAALLVLMYLVWGGIEWITSGGDKGKTESARNKITAAVIGLIILAAAYAIFNLVIQFIGLDPSNIFGTVQTIEGA
jgi:hypothetical protein